MPVQKHRLIMLMKSSFVPVHRQKKRFASRSGKDVERLFALASSRVPISVRLRSLKEIKCLISAVKKCLLLLEAGFCKVNILCKKTKTNTQTDLSWLLVF